MEVLKWTTRKVERMPHKTFSASQKLQAVQSILEGKKRPTQVARELNVAEGTLIKWRKLYAEHGEAAFRESDNQLETLTRERQLEKKVAELERVLGQMTFENTIMKTALDLLERTNGKK
jgi:transposase-like protein